MNLIDSMAAHPEVKSRDCGDGITSFNFTRKGLRAGLTRIWLGRTPRRINDDLAFLIDNGMDQETISAYMVDSISGPEVNLPELVRDCLPEW